MAFVDDREDINSICLTAVQRLLDNYGAEPERWSAMVPRVMTHCSSCRPRPQGYRADRSRHRVPRRQVQVDEDDADAAI